MYIMYNIIISILNRVVRYHANRFNSKAYRSNEDIVVVVALSLVLIITILCLL